MQPGLAAPRPAAWPAAPRPGMTAGTTSRRVSPSSARWRPAFSRGPRLRPAAPRHAAPHGRRPGAPRFPNFRRVRRARAPAGPRQDTASHSVGRRAGDDDGVLSLLSAATLITRPHAVVDGQVVASGRADARHPSPFPRPRVIGGCPNHFHLAIATTPVRPRTRYREPSATKSKQRRTAVATTVLL